MPPVHAYDGLRQRRRRRGRARAREVAVMGRYGRRVENSARRAGASRSRHDDEERDMRAMACQQPSRRRRMSPPPAPRR